MWKVAKAFLPVSSGALTGSWHKTRRRQVAGILSTPMTVGSTTPNIVPDAQVTPINVLEALVKTTLPAPVNTIQAEPATGPLMLEPIEEVQMQQQGMDSQCGGSYITNMQTENVGSVSLYNVDSVA